MRKTAFVVFFVISAIAIAVFSCYLADSLIHAIDNVKFVL